MEKIQYKFITNFQKQCKKLSYRRETARQYTRVVRGLDNKYRAIDVTEHCRSCTAAL